MQRGQARQVISVLLQRLVETTRIGATGGASSSPTKSERDSAVLEGLVRREGTVRMQNQQSVHLKARVLVQSKG